MIRNISGWLTICLLSACSSAPENHYYTLFSVPPKALSAGPQWLVSNVRLPAILDRPQLVERTGAGTVDIHEFERWAEPLDQAVPRILNEDLPIPASSSSTYQPKRLSVEFDRFVAGTDDEVSLAGSWQELARDGLSEGGPINRFTFSIRTDHTRTNEIVASMSALLGQLAGQISQSR